MNLDWHSIRPLNGGRDKGFEELCAQLARAETPSGATFVRKGTPDAGVECYAVFRDLSEWGWQSKYFDVLGDTQWSQIDESVKTALAKHPTLVRYFIGVPLDLPEGRIEGRKSARERWDDHSIKWSGWASARGMKVEFVYWGSSELLERLTRREHVGRVRFWFDVRGFDSAWFGARLDEALRTAGPRYTPEVHVDLPISWEFEAFGRTKSFFDREKARARKIRAKFGDVRRWGGPAEPAIEAALTQFSSKVRAILQAFSAIDTQPVGLLPLNTISNQIDEIETKANEVSQLLEGREREFDRTKQPPSKPDDSRPRNSYRDHRIRMFHFIAELRGLQESLRHADAMAKNSVMVLNGAAGTGKTHLLCDISRKRVAAGLPTVLLMGQRFVNNDAPWPQALQQLDLPGLSAEEFVGALEAAAQAADARALLVIDAINEGAGRNIWPSHLSAFLLQAQRSAWIGVVLSVRSAYEGLVVPPEVRSNAATVTHHGFAENEYDATKTFFIYYGLELPSTPFLAPEFRNPLFLKTLCRGLNETGERRLPRGLRGITAVFDLHLKAIEERLALSLDFDRRAQLVRRALEALSEPMQKSGERWLSYAKAVEIVNSFLPGRGYERSLYRGLVAEGVLVEEVVRRDEEVVFLSYERFADHLTVKALLDKHLEPHAPASAFSPGAPLAFVCDEGHYLSPGMLEALCIQIPERTGQELIALAPACAQRRGLGDAFRQSLVWRAYSAFSEGTREVLNQLIQTEHDDHDTLDVLLTVATLPEHPFNAEFLDSNLRNLVMADRDAWWSIYLHKAWRSAGAVDRLVDWAWSVSDRTAIDDDAVDLCAIALSWMLTTANRFLRDRATKALVNLLTSRIAAVTRLIGRFADVDDPYVAERVYAVAYGVSMRRHDPAAVGALATSVYNNVFRSGTPFPNILLRDYARGVVERALYLGSAIDVTPELVRPPYRSTWPRIPTEEDIKPLLPEWSKGSHDSRELEWARNRIGSSIMSDDFGRYVIGTNSSSTANDWLSLTLDDPLWKPPPRPEDQLRSLKDELSTARELEAWEKFETVDKEYSFASVRVGFVGMIRPSDGETPLDGSEGDLPSQNVDSSDAALEAIAARRNLALEALESVLNEEQARRLREILESKRNYFEAGRPPHLTLSLIQRYVLWRVFDMGWTIDRFGAFDRFSIGYHGREAAKAERIGKKYQWIAYHEILALISDRFQYWDAYRQEKGDQAYEGPWQDFLRDIDPSCTMRSLRGGTSWEGHVPAWWGPTQFDSWGAPDRQREWVLDPHNLPRIEELLTVTNPTDNSLWVNVDGYFNWRQQPPVDRESTEAERRELWYIATGYLIREGDAQRFVAWAQTVDFWGRWMPDAPEVHTMFLGEHGWAPASHYFRQEYYGDGEWTTPNNDCPVQIRTVAFEYNAGGSGFDCSLDDTFRLSLLNADIVKGLGVRWNGYGADFVDTAGQVIAQDPTVHAKGPTALLIREDALRDYLAREKLAIVWAVLGEKSVLAPGFGSGPHHARVKMSGAYTLSGGVANGFLNCTVEEPPGDLTGSAKEG